jgi:hypothetical protein
VDTQNNQSEDQETQGTQADGPGDGQSDGSVDWEARAREAESQLARKDNTLRSIQGNQRKQRERDDQLEELTAGFSSLSKSVAAIGNAVMLPEDERAPAVQSLNQIQVEAQESLNKSRAARVQQAYRAQIDEANLDDEGLQIFDLEEAPELATARTLWSEGDYVRAGSEFNRQVLASQRSAARKAIEEERKNAKDGQKKAAGDALEKASLHDTSVPSRGGGGSRMTKSEAATALNRGDITSAEYSKYR